MKRSPVLPLAVLAAWLSLSSMALAQQGPVSAPPSQPASGTITTGGTFQAIIPSAAGTRKGCLIQNPITATETLFVYFGPIANASTAGSFELPAGGSLTCSTGTGQVSDQVSVDAVTTGHAFKAAFQ